MWGMRVKSHFILNSRDRTKPDEAQIKYDAIMGKIIIILYPVSLMIRIPLKWGSVRRTISNEEDFISTKLFTPKDPVSGKKVLMWK